MAVEVGDDQYEAIPAHIQKQVILKVLETNPP
jgi:hypothetical protein